MQLARLRSPSYQSSELASHIKKHSRDLILLGLFTHWSTPLPRAGQGYSTCARKRRGSQGRSALRSDAPRSMWPKQIGGMAIRAEVWPTDAALPNATDTLVGRRQTLQSDVKPDRDRLHAPGNPLIEHPYADNPAGVTDDPDRGEKQGHGSAESTQQPHGPSPHASDRRLCGKVG